MTTTNQTRPLFRIAREIRKDWKNVYFGAEPYLNAMLTLDSINDDYLFDSGKEIVLRFIGQSGTWRGETARRVKAELKQMAGLK